IVSELVANALRYGNGPGRLRLMRGERLCVEVSDTGPDLPQIQHASYSAEGGRGLQLVNALCRRWGSCRTPGGKIVWAEQDLPGGGGAAGAVEAVCRAQRASGGARGFVFTGGRWGLDASSPRPSFGGAIVLTVRRWGSSRSSSRPCLGWAF